MNIDNNHLVSEEWHKEMSETEREKYQQVPDTLYLNARLELMGKEETVVGKESTGKINTWATKQRKKRKRKAKIIRY